MTIDDVLAALPPKTPDAIPLGVEHWDKFRARLIPQKVVRTLRGDVSNMTLYRHVKKKISPPPIVIDGRNYWTLGEILDANESDKNRRQKYEEGKALTADCEAASDISLNAGGEV